MTESVEAIMLSIQGDNVAEQITQMIDRLTEIQGRLSDSDEKAYVEQRIEWLRTERRHLPKNTDNS